jgi:hypothetical protein
MVSLHGSGARLAVTHARPVQNIQKILTLGEEQAITSALH